MQNKWKLCGETNGTESTSIYHTVLPAQPTSVCSHILREVLNQNRQITDGLFSSTSLLIGCLIRWNVVSFCWGPIREKYQFVLNTGPWTKKSLAIMQVESLPACCCQTFNGISTACCVSSWLTHFWRIGFSSLTLLAPRMDAAWAFGSTLPLVEILMIWFASLALDQSGSFIFTFSSKSRLSSNLYLILWKIFFGEIFNDKWMHSLRICATTIWKFQAFLHHCKKGRE